MLTKNGLVAVACALLLIACSAEDKAPLLSGVHLEALDRETRPQDDFYQFVNGGWLDSTEIPDIYSGYTVYHEVKEIAELALREIINQAADSPGEPGSESQQVGDIYASWMDTETIDAPTVAPRCPSWIPCNPLSRSSLVRNRWPTSREGVEVPYIAAFTRISKIPRAILSICAIRHNHAGPRLLPGTGQRKLRCSPGGAGALYRKHAGPCPACDPGAAADVYALEIQIAEAQWDAVRNRDPQAIYNPYKLDALQEFGANMHWSSTLAILGVDGEQQIIVEQPELFRSAGQNVRRAFHWRHGKLSGISHDGYPRRAS